MRYAILALSLSVGLATPAWAATTQPAPKEATGKQTAKKPANAKQAAVRPTAAKPAAPKSGAEAQPAPHQVAASMPTFDDCFRLGWVRGVHVELGEQPAFNEECMANKVPFETGNPADSIKRGSK